MNSKHTAQQLRLAAAILETGHPWEHKPYKESQWLSGEGKCPLQRLANGNEIRPILATPPDGRPLHNPDNLTAEEVGFGYRLALKGERVEAEATEFWYEGEWLKTAVTSHADKSAVFRLPLSVPWPEAPDAKDPYAELKEAYKAGKTIQFNVGKFASPDAPDAWEDRENLHWDQPVHLYRVEPEAPAFQLPPPPPGMQWHREDGWQAGMLERGERPLVKGELYQKGDLFGQARVWKVVEGIAGDSVDKWPDGDFSKTTRSLTFQHADKTWTWHRPGDPMPCKSGESIFFIDTKKVIYNSSCPERHFNEYGDKYPWPIIGWRYAESETKEVKLGPEDVPPGSVFRRDDWQPYSFRMVVTLHERGVCLGAGHGEGVVERSYNDLQIAAYKINRSIPLTGKWNPDAWEPCSKEVPA